MATVTTTRRASCGTLLSSLAGTAVVLVILALFTAGMLAKWPWIYSEADCDGYLLMAKRLASGGPLAVRDANLFTHQAHLWVENVAGEVAAKFSPGYMVALALAYRLGGDNGMLWVNPLVALLGLLGTYRLSRNWMGTWPAVLTTACLAATPMFIFHAGYVLTHPLEITLTVWGMNWLWRWYHRGSWTMAVGAGLCLGLAVTVRYTSILAVLPILVLVLGRLIALRRARPGVWVKLGYYLGVALLAIAWCVGPLLLAWYQDRVFGSPLTSGYTLSGEDQAFTWAQLGKNYLMLAKGLSTDGLFLLCPLGLLGMWLSGTWSERLARAAWFFPPYYLYCAYYWTPAGTHYYRFMLHTFPLLAASAFLLLSQLRATSPLRLAALMGAVALIYIGINLSGIAGNLAFSRGHDETRLIWDATQATERALPPDAVIFTTGPLTSYLPTRAHYQLYDLAVFSPSYDQQLRYEEQRWDQPWSQPLRRQRLHLFYHQHSAAKLLQQLKQVVADAHASGRAVAVIVPTNDWSRWSRVLGPAPDTWQTLATLQQAAPWWHRAPARQPGGKAPPAAPTTIPWLVQVWAPAPPAPPLPAAPPASSRAVPSSLLLESVPGSTQAPSAPGAGH